MNILLLNTHDSGGAAKAVRRLQQNLKARGHRTVLFCRHGHNGDPEIVRMPRPGFVKRIRQTLVRPPRTDPRYHFYNIHEETGYLSTAVLLRQLPFRPDAIVANWISTFLNTANLLDLSKATGAPVLWYLLDMAPMTGGCHYAWDCTGYHGQCGCCPALHSGNPADLSFRTFRCKRQAVEAMDLTVVPASAWLTDQVRQGTLFAGKPCEQILLGIDPDLFHPMDRAAARRTLGLPADRTILYFGSDAIREERKGGTHLLAALQHLKTLLSREQEQTVLLATAGHDDDRPLQGIPLDHRSLGILREDRQVALAYQAADIFVCPSIEDAGPMMINEAILCGTPVVSFDRGVAPDLVHTGETGYRARWKDSADMAAGLARLILLDGAERMRLAANCRELGLRLCHPTVQAARFERLMQERRFGGSHA